MKNPGTSSLKLAAVSALAAAGFSFAAVAQNAPVPAPYPGKHITQGPGKMTAENLYECKETNPSFRKTPLGTITATDGKVIILPAETIYTTGVKAGGDLQNYCIGVDPKTLDEVKALTDKTPVIEIDPDGEVITGYLNADNYFEMYVNEKLVAVDAVPYTPMNGSIVRFKAKRPYTIAIKMVDWEENLGLGSELNRNNKWHPGDGGVMARFSDGTVTDSTWRAQSFYIGPLVKLEDLLELPGNLHSTEKLGRTHPLRTMPTCEDKCFGVHYDIPADWKSKAFNDKVWPRAYEFTDDEMGINAMVSYTRFPQLFTDARWIWSQSLVYDNVVIVRKTVQ